MNAINVEQSATEGSLKRRTNLARAFGIDFPASSHVGLFLAITGCVISCLTEAKGQEIVNKSGAAVTIVGTAGWEISDTDLLTVKTKPEPVIRVRIANLVSALRRDDGLGGQPKVYLMASRTHPRTILESTSGLSSTKYSLGHPSYQNVLMTWVGPTLSKFGESKVFDSTDKYISWFGTPCKEELWTYIWVEWQYDELLGPARICAYAAPRLVTFTCDGKPVGGVTSGLIDGGGSDLQPGESWGNPPLFTEVPKDLVVPAGGTIRLTVRIDRPAVIVPFKGGVMVSLYESRTTVSNAGQFATEMTLTIVQAAPGDSGEYWFNAIGDSGGAVTRRIRVTVGGSGTSASGPVITVPPQSQSVVPGTRVTFSVTATGTAPLSYQWRKNGVNIPGATASSFSIASAQPSDAAGYTVVVSNSAGLVTSVNATLIVNAPTAPAITGHPQNQTVPPGQAVTFTVSATGTAPLSYQWRKNSVNINGATAASFSIPSVKTTDAGSYTVVVSNAAGSTASNPATLTVSPVNAGAAPVITAHPQNQTVSPGQRVSLSVAVTGTAPLSYQWRKNGSNISGATSASFSIPSAQAADAGSYTVIVSNAQGNVTSNVAIVSVSASSTPTGTSPGPDWVLNPANGHYYKVLNGVKWKEAQAAAVAQGANLATIRNTAENDWLLSQFGNVRRWIGFTDEAVEGKWVWISGEPVTYSNWLSGEPNNWDDEDFAVINFDSPGKWNDLKATDADTSSAIIEWIPGAVQGAKKSQIINFPVIGNQILGGPPITLIATADSGLPVVFERISGAASLNGSILTITDTGAITIRASQPGNTEFLPAFVERTFNVQRSDFAPRLTVSFVGGRIQLDYTVPAGIGEITLNSAPSIESLGRQPVVLYRAQPPANGRGQILLDPALSGRLAFFQLVTGKASLSSAPSGMVLIRAGTFKMGSPMSELGRLDSEVEHTVTLSRDFYLQTTEVTWAQWNEVRSWAVQNGYTDLGAGRNGMSGDASGTHPVTEVSWFDAIKWLNAWSEKERRTPCYTVGAAVYRTGQNTAVTCDWSASGFRLPTEAEWEYACRAGTTTAFYTGSITYADYLPLDLTLDIAGWYFANSGGNSHPVGRKVPNAWLLLDMLGNVQEWCWDLYGSYGSGAQTDPRGSVSGPDRVYRGGGWRDKAQWCRSSKRAADFSNGRYWDRGLRPALSSGR